MTEPGGDKTLHMSRTWYEGRDRSTIGSLRVFAERRYRKRWQGEAGLHAGSSSRPPDSRPPTKTTWVLPPVMAVAVAASLDGLFHSRKSSTATAAPPGVADHRYRAVKRGAASSCRGVGPCVVQRAREANQTPSKGRQP